MPNTPLPRTALVDDKIYKVVALKEGGMGRVWLLARQYDEPFDPIYRRRLAVKTFDFVRDQAAIEQELNAWISIVHPCVLPLKKIGRLNYRLAAIMPFMLGTLDDELDSVGPFPERAVIQVLMQATSALNHAWQKRGILHLDLKPSNILVKEKEPLQIQIADWGISRLANEGNSKITSYLAGTPLYMSPERFSGSWSLSPKADIYSLGMMAIHLLRGTLPFRFGEIDPLLEIQSGAYRNHAASMLTGSSGEFQRVVLECIDPNPAHRRPTFAQLLSDFERLV
jgi:serine/threonine-protein kinase